MKQILSSEGKCLYCNQIFTQKEIEKHLAKHLAEMEKIATNGKAIDFCHIVAESNEMFLHLLVKNSTTCRDLDDYLKEIWVECCDHMSAFTLKNNELAMSKKVQMVFEPKVKLQYSYDFGSTTRFSIKCLKYYKLDLKAKIILLSRNEPLKLICSICNAKPAINICTTCIYEKYAFYCEECSVEHAKECSDFEDYSCMPVVNSPRMGICVYTGGQIDLERDGVYKVKES